MMTKPVYSGSCACGAVKVAIDTEPSGPYQCYCRQCQRVSSGAAATVVVAPREHVRIDGDVATFTEPTTSGNKASRSFCPKCGTAVFSEGDSAPGIVAVKLGALTDVPPNKVQAIFWTSEAPHWATIDPDIFSHPTQPAETSL